jgi:FkbM family methyltransferase
MHMTPLNQPAYEQPSIKVIYDLGANTGDDLAYYLKKADKVVAVEANPTLAKQIESNYSAAISEGRLFVENCVVTTLPHSADVPFYMHKHGHIISQFPKPAESELVHFDEVMLPSKSVLSLIEEHGHPYYIKIDIEGYDHEIVRNLIENRIFPEFISAESHSIEVFALLASSNFYTSFNLVDGRSVVEKYKNTPISTLTGPESFSFPSHAAGPFGEDIKSPWMTSEHFFELLAYEGLGWKDIHATNKPLAKPENKALFSDYAKSYLLKKMTPKFLRPLFNIND